MAQLAEAIALQGKPRVSSSRQFLNDIIRIDQGKKREKGLAQQQQRKREREMEDLVYSSADIDYNKIHPFHRSKALGATKDFFIEATGYADQPNARLRVANSGEQLKEYIAGLNQSSQGIRALEDYVGKGGYINDEDRKVLNYFNSGGNPLYIQDFDPSKTAAVRGFDPEMGNVVFDPFDKISLEARATKKYFTPKERVAGREGRFDIIEETFDPEEVKDLAFQDAVSDEIVFKNAELEFGEQARSQLEKEINPLTGRKLYPEIDQNTVRDPSFVDDYRNKVAMLYADYAAGLGVPSKEKLKSRPRPRTGSQSTTYGSGTSLTDFGWQQGSDGYYNDGRNDVKYTSAWKGSTQPVNMNLTGSQGLFKASDGTFENKTGIQSYQTGETEISPVYTEGANKGKPVPDDRLEEDKGKYKYEALMDLSQTTKTGSGVLSETVVTPYLANLSKVKSGYLLGLTENEKKSALAQFNIIENEVKRLNKELKESTKNTPAKPAEKNSFRENFNNAESSKSKAPRPR